MFKRASEKDRRSNERIDKMVSEMGKQAKLIEEENSSYYDIRVLLDELYSKFEELAEESKSATEKRKRKIEEIMEQFNLDLLDAAKTIEENRDDEW